MGRLDKIKPIEVKVRLEDYVHLLVGQKKTGKTTLFRDLVNLHYNGDMTKGFLAGFEKGTNTMDGLYSAQIEDWEDWESYVEEFVEDRKTTSFKLICVDTIDYFVDMAVKETLRMSKKKDGKIVTSINEAFSGYGKGKEYAIKIMRESILKLQNNGYGLVFIAHSKLKKKNTGLLSDNLEFMQLSCSLTNDYAGLFEDMADMITYLVLERDVDTTSEEVGGRTAKSSVKMVFRSEDGGVDCGGRFKDLPSSLDYSAENYLTAFTQGVKSSILKPTTDKEIKEMAIKQEEEKEIEIESKTKAKSVEEMMLVIRDKFAELGEGGKQELARIIQESGKPNMKSLIEEDRKYVEEMYEIAK